jgi:hypothetical protein
VMSEGARVVVEKGGREVMRRVDWSRVKDPQWACKRNMCAHWQCWEKRAAKMARQQKSAERKGQK